MKIIVLYFIFINIIGFISMGIDKRKAIRQSWRISERFLFLVAICGGTLGSWLGMYAFRHKTKHLQFKLGMPILLICQMLIFIVWRGFI